MHLRPRGVWSSRVSLRCALPVSFSKALTVACVAVMAGCASVPSPSSNSSDQPTSLLSQQSPLISGLPASTDVAVARNRQRTPGQRLNAPLQRQEATEDLSPQVVDLTVQPSDIWTRLRRSFAVPNIDTPLVKEWENFYASRPDYLQRTAERAGKYLFYIIEEIDQRGMPSELALLPFVESSYDPWALSSAKASGLWQFIPSTGRGFNLKQDWWRDERRDPIASTRAALEYLQYLFDFHGDWHLALASYNWGEGSVKRAIDKKAAQDLPTDYLSLDMPDETRNYIPKLQAIKNIIANPAAFNIALPTIENQPYFVTVTGSRNIDVKLAAKLAEMPLDDFKALNPSFNRGVILGRHEPTLLLPADRIGVFETNLQAYNGALSSWHTHQLKRGETLASVAKKYRTSISNLRHANGLSARSRLSSGDILMVPSGAAAEATMVASNAVRPAVASRGNSVKKSVAVRTHKIKRGDTLSSLAQRYGTSVQQLRALNGLRGSALRVGQTLQIPGTGVRS